MHNRGFFHANLHDFANHCIPHQQCEQPLNVLAAVGHNSLNGLLGSLSDGFKVGENMTNAIMADRDLNASKQPTVDDDAPILEMNSRPTSSREDSHGSTTALERKGSLQSLRRQATLPRRRSSNVSDFSTRSMMRDSTDNLLPPRTTPAKSEDTSHWDSIPLAFAILPAVGGLFFENGSAFITDVFLLGLGGLFLHGFVRMPW